METYSTRLAERLPQYCDLDLIALPGQANGDAPSTIRLLAFGAQTFVRVLFARRSAQVTHIGDMASWPLALAARMRTPGSRQVLSAHGTDVSFAFRGGPRHGIYKWYLGLGRRMLPGATILANSTATSEVLSRLGYRNVHVVPLAADTPEILPRLRPGHHLLFAGRIIGRKGLSWFVRSVLPLLPPEITVKAAGPIWDETEAECLQNPRVHYLGTLDPGALKRAYRDALAVIVPNLDMTIGHLEGFGLVATEAAAAGAVVLASDTGGLRDAIIDTETGFHIPSGKAQAWAAKIIEVQSWDQTARDRFLDHSLETCREHFSWDRVTRDTASHYAPP